jgi:hypothetical protein
MHQTKRELPPSHSADAVLTSGDYHNYDVTVALTTLIVRHTFNTKREFMICR